MSSSPPPLLLHTLALAAVIVCALALFAGVVGLRYVTLAFDTPIDEPPNSNCTCSCWDGILKEGAPVPADKSYYHSIYINTDRVTVLLVVLCITYIVAAFCFFHALGRAYARGRLRPWLWAVALLAVLYPNMYNFWSIFHYLNDRWFQMMGHQVYFAVSEAAAAIVVTHHLDTKRGPLQGWSANLVFSIAVVHLVQLFGVDESLLASVTGRAAQWPRNLLFAGGDLALAVYFGREARPFHHWDRDTGLAFAGACAAQLVWLNVLFPTPR